MKDNLKLSKRETFDYIFYKYPEGDTLNKIEQDFDLFYLIDIIDKYKNEIDFTYFALNRFIPQIVYIKFIDEFIKLDIKYWKTIMLTEQLIILLQTKITDENLLNQYWYYLSQNSTLPLINNFEKYMDKIAYNRFSYNLNFPMDINFIQKYKHKINICDLKKHEFLTDEVKDYLNI